MVETKVLMVERIQNTGRGIIQALLVLAFLPASLRCAEPKRAPLTQMQAVDAIRAQPDVKLNASYMVLREFKPTPEGAKLAKLALGTARRAHRDLFRDGVLASLLREGGYLVVEFDGETKLPLHLYYVTRDADGREMVDKENISTEDSEDKATADDVSNVILETQFFITKLLKSASTDLPELVRASFDRVPTYDTDIASYFGVPRNFLGFATQREIEDFSALFSASHLWGFRHALSLPQYSANPRNALITAFEQREKMISHFLRTKTQSDDEPCLSEPLRIRTPEQLKQCLGLLRQLNAYLDAQAVPSESQWVFDLNLSLAALPFDMGCTRGQNPGETGCTLALTTGLILVWVVHADGKFKLAAISEDE